MQVDIDPIQRGGGVLILRHARYVLQMGRAWTHGKQIFAVIGASLGADDPGTDRALLLLLRGWHR